MQVAGGLQRGDAGRRDQQDGRGQQQQPQVGRRAEEGGDPAGHWSGPAHPGRGADGAQHAGGMGGLAGRGRGGGQGGAGDGAGSQLPVTGDGSGPFVGPPFQRVTGGRGDRAQQRVGGGGQPRRGGEQVMQPGGVGAFVSQQDLAFGLA